MNPQLKNVQTAFDKVKEISERRKKLEAEQQELQAKIATLTAAVAKARSESALPAELSAVQRDYDRAICALRDTLPPLSPMVAKAYGKERERMAAVAGEFLSGYLEDAYLVEVLTRQITENSKTVRALDFLNTRFSSGHITQPVGAAAVISRANNALAGLANVP